MKTEDTLILAAAGLGALYLFKKDVSKVTGGIGEAVSGLGSGVNQIGTSVGNVVETTGENINQVIESGGELGSNVLDIFTNLFKGGYNLGRSLVGNKNNNENSNVDELGRENVSPNDKSLKSYDVSSLSQIQMNFLATLPESERQTYIDQVNSRSKQPIQTTIEVKQESNSKQSNSNTSNSNKSSKSLKRGESYSGVTKTGSKNVTVSIGDFGKSLTGNKITKKIVIS